MMLRPRQKLFVERSLAALDTHNNTLGIGPTGCGKSILLSAVAGDIIRKTAAKVCIIAHRDELTEQNRAKFGRVNPAITTSVVDANKKSWEGQATFAMVPTLSRPANLDGMPKLDLLVIDEAHHEDGGGENDNNAMMFFLTERVERLREAVAPDCGVILAHHTKKMNRKAVGEDPFQALSGASALRGFYTSGLLMHRPDEESSMRRLEIELRNGPALPTKLIDKENGRWIELNPMNERLVRQDIGAKHDAERDRKGDVILNLIAEQGMQGKMYTLMQFASKFENKGSLGGETSIRNRIHVLATKGHVKFVRGEEAERLGLPQGATKYGYLCVKDMVLQTDAEHVNSETGEVEPAVVKVVPTHFMCPQTGAVLPVENPDVWVDQEVD